MPRLLVRETVIGLIKWLRPKGLKVCSYVEKCAEFKNLTLKKIGWYTKVLCATEYPKGVQYLKIALKWGGGVPLQVYTLKHVISVENANFGSRHYIMINVQYKTE